MNLEQLLKDVTVLHEIVGTGNMEEAETMIELIAIDIRAAQQADAKEYAKTAHEITQSYIESYGAQFANIDALDNAIASALREAATIPLFFTASTYGLFGFPEKAHGAIAAANANR